MNIWIINGPNLNLLGVREPEIYGTRGFDGYFEELQKDFPDDSLHCFQSNCEGELIDKIHEVGFSCDGIVLNAGAYSHTSLAIADAVAAVTAPVVEVHISNTAKREEFRHKSWLTSVCAGIVAGFGLKSYELAVRAVKDI